MTASTISSAYSLNHQMVVTATDNMSAYMVSHINTNSTVDTWSVLAGSGTDAALLTDISAGQQGWVVLTRTCGRFSAWYQNDTSVRYSIGTDGYMTPASAGNYVLVRRGALGKTINGTPCKLGEFIYSSQSDYT